MKERTVIGTDNRDPSTTVLHLDDGSDVEVNPKELYVNSLENNPPEHDYEDAVAVQRFIIICEHVAASKEDMVTGRRRQQIIDELVHDGNYQMLVAVDTDL